MVWLTALPEVLIRSSTVPAGLGQPRNATGQGHGQHTGDALGQEHEPARAVAHVDAQYIGGDVGGADADHLDGAARDRVDPALQGDLLEDKVAGNFKILETEVGQVEFQHDTRAGQPQVGAGLEDQGHGLAGFVHEPVLVVVRCRRWRCFHRPRR